MTLKTCKFKASEDIITKLKSQGLHIIIIKYWNASGSGHPPSLISTLWNIGILHHKEAKLPKHLQHSVCETGMVILVEMIYCTCLVAWVSFFKEDTYVVKECYSNVIKYRKL
jgi:hypothetical protein